MSGKLTEKAKEAVNEIIRKKTAEYLDEMRKLGLDTPTAKKYIEEWDAQMSELLRCENLTKDYGGFRALNGINLSLESGKIVGLLGPNGSGKTTMIKILNGLLTPTAGKIYINGHEPGVETKKIVAYLPDNIYLGTWMSVKQIVDLFADFYADFRPDLAYDMLGRLGISAEVKLKTLSKGNKEKVCLILVMARNALLYVLDELIAGITRRPETM